MEATPEPAERLSAESKSVGIAIAQENQQWMHRFNVINAQNNSKVAVEYTPTETFQHRYGRRLALRRYTIRRSKSLPAPPKPYWYVESGPRARNAHPAPPRARNAHPAPPRARNAYPGSPRIQDADPAPPRARNPQPAQNPRPAVPLAQIAQPGAPRAQNPQPAQNPRPAVPLAQIAQPGAPRAQNPQPAPPRAPNVRDAHNIRRVRDGAIQKLRRAKNVTVHGLRWIGYGAYRMLENNIVGIDIALLAALVYTHGRVGHYQALAANSTAAQQT